MVKPKNSQTSHDKAESVIAVSWQTQEKPNWWYSTGRSQSIHKTKDGSIFREVNGFTYLEFLICIPRAYIVKQLGIRCATRKEYAQNLEQRDVKKGQDKVVSLNGWMVAPKWKFSLDTHWEFGYENRWFQEQN